MELLSPKQTFNLLFLLFIIGMLPSVMSEITSYGSYKTGDCVTIRQTCASCTYVNLSVSYPNSTLAVINQEMLNQGGGVWTYEFCNTSILGRYDVTGSGDLEGNPTSFDVLYFDINQYGIDAKLYWSYAFFYLLLIFASFLFVYKFATYNGRGVRDPNFFLWASFLNFISYVLIEIYGFGGTTDLISDAIKIISLAIGIYFLALGIFDILDWGKYSKNR